MKTIGYYEAYKDTWNIIELSIHELQKIPCIYINVNLNSHE